MRSWGYLYPHTIRHGVRGWVREQQYAIEISYDSRVRYDIGHNPAAAVAAMAAAAAAAAADSACM